MLVKDNTICDKCGDICNLDSQDLVVSKLDDKINDFFIYDLCSNCQKSIDYLINLRDK